MILMYHKVAPQSPTMWWVEVDAFRRQLLQLRGRHVVYLDDYDPKDPRQAVITFDGVYRNVLEFAAPLLAEQGYPFELFVTGNYVGGDNAFDTVEPRAEFASAEELQQLIALGGRLQWHGNAHVNLGDVRDDAVIRGELAVPEPLRALDPKGFRWFGYPHGTFSPAVLDAVRQQFDGGLSCHQGSDADRHCLNRVTVTNETNLGAATVSVVIPCFNYGTYLAEAVESVLRQTYPADEILISDDASTDDTPLIAAALARKFGDRLRVHRNAKTLGIVDHFNQAVGMTRGDYVCFLGADNRFRSDYLEHTAGTLERAPQAAIAYTDFALFGSRAPIIAAELGRSYPTRMVGDTYHVVEFPEFDDASRARLLEKENFIHGSSMFRRSAFEQVGGYARSGKPEDWQLFQRMVAAGWQAVRCPQPLLEYRQHSRDQANVKLISELNLHHYREGFRHLEARNRELEHELRWFRRLMTPVRVARNLARKARAAFKNASPGRGGDSP